MPWRAGHEGPAFALNSGTAGTPGLEAVAPALPRPLSFTAPADAADAVAVGGFEFVAVSRGADSEAA
jgi:hypothetical protein